MLPQKLHALIVLLCGFLACGPATPDGPTEAVGTRPDETAMASGPITATGDLTGTTDMPIASTGSPPSTSTSTATAGGPTSTTSSTVAGEGCLDAGDPAAVDRCSSFVDEKSCAVPCRWFSSRLFTNCSGLCNEAKPSGVCIALEQAPETGCTGPCAKFWLETPAGLQVFEADLCFEFPVAWAWCQLSTRPECECGCTTPP